MAGTPPSTTPNAPSISTGVTHFSLSQFSLIEHCHSISISYCKNVNVDCSEESTVELVPVFANLVHSTHAIVIHTIDLTNDENEGNLDIVNANVNKEDIDNLAEMFPNIARREIEAEYVRFVAHENALALTTNILIARCKSPTESDRVMKLVNELRLTHANFDGNELYARIEAALVSGMNIKDVRTRIMTQFDALMANIVASAQVLNLTKDVINEPPLVRPTTPIAPVDQIRPICTPVPVTPPIQLVVHESDVAGPSHALDDNNNNETSLTSQLQIEFGTIIQMFPRVDPAWVMLRLTGEGYRQSVDELILRMVAQPNYYDRIVTIQSKELTTRRRENMMDLAHFNIPEFLQVFPDPAVYFSDITAKSSLVAVKFGTCGEKYKCHLYEDHTLVALLNEFPMLQEDFIRKTIDRHAKHLYPAYKQLTQFINSDGQKPNDGPPKKKVKISKVNSSEFLSQIRTVLTPWPTNIDSYFFKELQFARWQHIIHEYQENGKREEEQLFNESRINEGLSLCEVCYLECILEEMMQCSEGHKFCKNCVVQMVEQKVGQGHHKVECLACDCAFIYEASVLRHLLSAHTFNRLITNIQQFDLRVANIPDLCMCPFCNFAIVIENENERLFTCLSPDCLKVSCRECKEADHLPLRCDEVEKDAEVKMRTYIEEKCAQALIRKCPTCQKPIMKTEGCNHMSCPCGAHFCYVCNAMLDKSNPYAHFNLIARSGRICKLVTHVNELHEEVALKAAKQARIIYLNEHPEMKHNRDVDVNLLVDKH